MNKYVYPTSRKVNEPFLLDSKSLIELDNIVNEIHKRFKEKIEIEISEKVLDYKTNLPEKEYQKYEDNLRKSYEYNKFNKSLTISLKNRTLYCKSFEEAIKDPANKEEITREFRYELTVGKYELEISLNYFYDSNLSVRIKPSEEATVQDNFYILNQWVDRYKSKKWIQVWKELRFWLIYIPVALLFMFWLISSSLQDIKTKGRINNEIGILLEDGIDSSEVITALEFLLIKESGKLVGKYKIDNHESTLGNSFYLLFAIIIITISFPPKSYLGIGKGDKLIRRWKFWIKFITISLPLGIVLPILINKISEII